jgi:EAL domain-containing protein (putative c-di-GMP-specific phosphodiesterase class I)
MATPPTTQQQRIPSQENLLLDYVHRLEAHKEDRKAVHIHLSALKSENRREHHIRVAANTFDPMIKMLDGQLFTLHNSDLFFIYKGEAQNDVETSILKLRFLFSDDPMMAGADEGDNTNFRTYYDVEQDYETILALTRKFVHDEGVEDEVEEETNSKAALQAKQSTGEPLTPRVLGRVEQALQRADLSNMVRRQFICGLIGQAAPQPLFSELFISIADLRETLMPGVNVTDSPWLFQHLTESLDRRMLAMLSKSNDNSITGEISINLNVSTLLSPEFMQFDDAVIASMRGSVVIELQKIDIFSDINAFLFAREFAKDRGYRICIDGLTYESISFINREKLGADMVKLIWNQELVDTVGKAKASEIVSKMGNSRIILCRCDDETAVEFGQSIGISMFQGRHIENLLAEENRRREMEMAKRRSQTLDFID